MSAAIQCVDVWRSFVDVDHRVDALAEVSIRLERGEVVAIVGPSGSGKTTLLDLCGALDQPTAGTIELMGTNLAGKSPSAVSAFRRRTIGFIFQDHYLVPHLTAIENVMYCMLGDDRSFGERRHLAEGALTDVGLSGRTDHFPNQLSGGERQRVAVARAIARRPSLVVADEPSASLDRATATRIFELIREQAAAGAAVLLSTHDGELAAQADRIVQLKDGRVV